MCWLVTAGVGFAGLAYDNADDTVDCGSGTSLDNMDSQTWAAWINITALPGAGGYMRILAKDSAGGDCNFLLLDGDDSGRLAFYFGDSGFRYASTVPSTGTWIHVAVTWDGSNNGTGIKLYVNGTEQSYSATSNGTAADDSGGNFFIGNRTDGIRPFNGSIQEVAVWNSVLTDTQISLLASSKLRGMPLMVSPSTLVLYAPLDSGTHGASADTDTAWDLSGNANNCNPDNGANNTGLTWEADKVLNYPSGILGE